MCIQILAYTDMPCRLKEDLNVCLDVCHDIIRSTFKRMTSVFEFDFLALCVCVCVYMYVCHMCRFPQRPEEDARYPKFKLQLELQLFVSHLMWTLGTHIVPSEEQEVLLTDERTLQSHLSWF